MSETTNCEINIFDNFNEMVINAHNDHYVNGKNELIDTSKYSSPNANQIYHFYSNGEITHQKGAWAYPLRTEFNLLHEIPGAKNLPFKFAKKAYDGTTYVILTQEECYKFRQEMNLICHNNR